jgi:outer membrane PBP1 activator LpoA protein
LALGTALVLAGCGDMPTKAPERVGFPDGTAAEAPDVEPSPATDLPTLADPVDAALFAPVRDALARGDWLAAHLALPTLSESAEPGATTAGAASTTSPAPYPSTSPPPSPSSSPSPSPSPSPSTALWHRYYAARIDHLRGALPAWQAGIDELERAKLPAGLTRELLQHRLTVAETAGDAGAALTLAARLYDLGGHAERSQEQCLEALWRAAQAVVADGAAQAADPFTRPWLDLARASATRGEQPERAAALQAWLATYPEHPAAALAGTLAQAAMIDARGDRLALLLPLSGPLAAAGDAVARGAFAAYYAERSPGLTLDVMDSLRLEPARALAVARELDTAVVIGPLDKLQVAEVLAAPPADQAVLALNRPEQSAAAATVLQLALAPEDEARQLAELAFSDGGRRALLLRPEGVWGDRMEEALRARWESLGADIATTARFGRASAYSEVLRAALSLDDSTQRSREVSRLVGATESMGRRREDLDTIFLLTRGSDDARALKPLINYHYAGDLPTYALSTADSGNTDRNRDRDLEGLRLLAMPWRLGTRAVPGLESADASGSYDALHALGADAYRIARNWRQLHSAAALRVDGVTAAMTADGQGVLRRHLLPAEFDRGTLTAR